MKKIKKMVAMLMIVAIMFGGMVFGADTSKNFEINTTIPGVLELKVSKTKSVNVSDWGTVKDMTGTSLADASLVQLYLHIKNNQRVNLTVNVSATAFSNTDTTTTYVIPYIIQGEYTAPITVNSTAITEITFATIAHDNRGLRVDTVPFSVDPDDDKFTNAAAGSYSSMITFKIYAP